MWQFENLHILTEVTVEIIYDITFAEHKGNRNAHVLLELGMAHTKYGEGNDTHSSILAWKIPWTEEPGGLQSMGSLRIGHDWATSLSLFTFMYWGRKWQPALVFLAGESQGQGSLVACCLWSRAEWTRLKQLSGGSILSIHFYTLRWQFVNIQKTYIIHLLYAKDTIMPSFNKLSLHLMAIDRNPQ